MDHAKVQELFSDYRDGTLDGAQAAEVEAHLSTCAACKHEFDAFRSALKGLGKLKAEAPPDFLAQVQGQIRRRSRGRFFVKRSPWARFPLELVSLITLMIMLVVYLFLQIAQPSKVHEGGGGAAPAGKAR